MVQRNRGLISITLNQSAGFSNSLDPLARVPFQGYDRDRGTYIKHLLNRHGLDMCERISGFQAFNPFTSEVLLGLQFQVKVNY